VNFNSILIGSENAGALAEIYTRILGKPMYEGDG
jgi:hypothetical protein